MTVSGVVLAAGMSSRFAGEVPKQLLVLGDRPLLRWVAEAAICSRLAEVVVVLGHAPEQVAGALAGLDVTHERNPDYPRGQRTSVRAGLAGVASEARAALFMLADQPLLSSQLIDRLIDAHLAGGKIVVPTHARRRGAPVLFDRAFFAELAALEGDAGGRKLLPHHRSRIVEVEVEDPLELADVDTEEDLKRLAQLSSRSSSTVSSS